MLPREPSFQKAKFSTLVPAAAGRALGSTGLLGLLHPSRGVRQPRDQRGSAAPAGHCGRSTPTWQSPEPPPAAGPLPSVPGRAAPGRAEQCVDPVPSAVSNNGKSPQITGGKRKKCTAHGAAKLPSALLPLGSSTEPLAYATLLSRPWLKRCGDCSTASP